MKIITDITDRDGVPIQIGDNVELYDWGYSSRDVLLGIVKITWDIDEGRVSCEPCLISDPYDFWKKALPNCKVIRR